MELITSHFYFGGKGVLHALFHLILTKTVLSGYIHFYFTGEETEPPSPVTYPSLHN